MKLTASAGISSEVSGTAADQDHNASSAWLPGDRPASVRTSSTTRAVPGPKPPSGTSIAPVLFNRACSRATASPLSSLHSSGCIADT